MLGFEASGTVSADDYESVIIPAVDAADTGGHKLRMLYHVTSDFEKFDFGAMWDDAKVGLNHLTSFEKVAVVTDVDWIRFGLKVFAIVVPGEVRLFNNAELSEAKAWIAAD
ncbi:MAG: STAS/SEC14 domain-containing protein [Acidobacteriota bacterium]